MQPDEGADLPGDASNRSGRASFALLAAILAWLALGALGGWWLLADGETLSGVAVVLAAFCVAAVFLNERFRPPALNTPPLFITGTSVPELNRTERGQFAERLLRAWAGFIAPVADPKRASSLFAGVNLRVELAVALALTLVAAVPRLWSLGAIPQGIHGDEAQFAVDAQRVLSDVWIGPYITSALGQPSGIAYVIAPGQWLFGHTALGARFSIALYAIAAVPLLYALVRLHSSRLLAVTAAFLLGTSLWHIHFSRVAYQQALTPTLVLAVLICWWLAMSRGEKRWFVMAGALLGLGLYTYTVYPIFVLAFSIWVAIYTLVHRRGPQFRDWAGKVALAAFTSFVVGIPLFLYILNPANDFFSHYRGYYEQYSVLQSEAYQQGDFGEKIDVITSQVERYIGAYAWTGVTDFVDGASPDQRPMFDRITLALLVLGVLLALRRWREPVNQLALVMLFVLPLAGLLQTNATYRGSIAAVPFVAYLCALPVAFVWERGRELRFTYRSLVASGLAAVLALVAYTNVHTYFGPWANSDVMSWVYTQEISAASEYMDDLPSDTYVYFFSDRWSINYETRQYLAPDVQGEDRSSAFGQRQDYEIDTSRDSVFVLLPPYLDVLPDIQSLYPGGSFVTGEADGRALFIAYRLRAGQPSFPATDGGGQPLGGGEADSERLRDLRAIVGALQDYYDEEGEYPPTSGNPQSACIYEGIDALCRFQTELGAETLKDPAKPGYWYSSDGRTFTLFAIFDDQSLNQACDTPFFQPEDQPRMACLTVTR